MRIKAWVVSRLLVKPRRTVVPIDAPFSWLDALRRVVPSWVRRKKNNP